MSMLSKAKAAKLAGVSWGTIASRINDGKLSQSPEGIDVAELVRVFPQITTDRIETFLAGEPVSTGDNRGQLAGQPADTLSDANARLEERLKALDADNQWLRELLDRREQQLLEKDRQLAQQAEKIFRATASTRRGNTTGKGQSGDWAAQDPLGSTGTSEAVLGDLPRLG